jgi:hypothetical protein
MADCEALALAQATMVWNRGVGEQSPFNVSLRGGVPMYPQSPRRGQSVATFEQSQGSFLAHGDSS